MIDLDRFKEVNDTLGHHAGDLLLIEVARRLTDALEDDDVVARFGGDEFAIIAPGAGRDAASLLGEKISQHLEEPFDIMGSSLAIAASIGIALAPEHGAEGELLLRRADSRDVRRQTLPRTLCHLLRRPRRSRLRPPRNARRFPRGTRFGLSRSALPAEDRPRFRGPSRGRGPRAMDSPHARRGESGSLRPARRAGRPDRGAHRPSPNSIPTGSRPLAELGHEIGVAVNLSPHSLLNEDLPQQIAAHLEWAGVDGSMLTLEITEQSVIGDVPGR